MGDRSSTRCHFGCFHTASRVPPEKLPQIGPLSTSAYYLHSPIPRGNSGVLSGCGDIGGSLKIDRTNCISVLRGPVLVQLGPSFLAHTQALVCRPRRTGPSGKGTDDRRSRRRAEAGGDYAADHNLYMEVSMEPRSRPSLSCPAPLRWPYYPLQLAPACPE